MMFNATFNNISAILWQSALLVEETGVPRENHRPVSSHWQLYHIMLYRVHLAWAGFELATLVVKGTDYIGNCKSNYHNMITTMTTMASLYWYCITYCPHTEQWWVLSGFIHLHFSQYLGPENINEIIISYNINGNVKKKPF